MPYTAGGTPVANYKSSTSTKAHKTYTAFALLLTMCQNTFGGLKHAFNSNDRYPNRAWWGGGVQGAPHLREFVKLLSS